MQRSGLSWDCLHQERERPFEALRSRSGTLEVSQAHYDKIMRWDDQRSLASRTRHVICVPRHRKPTVTVDPAEAAVYRALIGFPCGRECTYELGIPFRENPLIVPNPVLKIQISKTCPVASRSQFVSLPEKVPKRIGFYHHCPDTELVEETLKSGLRISFTCRVGYGSRHHKTPITTPQVPIRTTFTFTPAASIPFTTLPRGRCNGLLIQSGVTTTPIQC